MARTPEHPSGPAQPLQIRLSPYHTDLLDSFCRPDRNRSQTIAKLLERADAGRQPATPVNQAPRTIHHGQWTPNIQKTPE